MYNIASEYITLHYNPIYHLKNYMIRVIIDYFTFVISDNIIKNNFHIDQKMCILSPNEILSLIPNYDIYNIMIKNEQEFPNYICFPKIIIDYINSVNHKNENKDNLREIIRILLFIN